MTDRRQELEDVIEKLKRVLSEAEDEMSQLTTWEDALFNCPLPHEHLYYIDLNPVGELYVRECLDSYDSRTCRNIMYSGRGFRTIQEVKDEIRRMTIRSKLEKVARCRNENGKLKMRADQPLYYIFYNKYARRLEQDEIHMLNLPAGTITCEDKSFLEDALKVIPREDLEWFCQDEE